MWMFMQFSVIYHRKFFNYLWLQFATGAPLTFKSHSKLHIIKLRLTYSNCYRIITILETVKHLFEICLQPFWLMQWSEIIQ